MFAKRMLRLRVASGIGGLQRHYAMANRDVQYFSLHDVYKLCDKLMLSDEVGELIRHSRSLPLAVIDKTDRNSRSESRGMSVRAQRPSLLPGTPAGTSMHAGQRGFASRYQVADSQAYFNTSVGGFLGTAFARSTNHSGLALDPNGFGDPSHEQHRRHATPGPAGMMWNINTVMAPPPPPPPRTFGSGIGSDHGMQGRMSEVPSFASPLQTPFGVASGGFWGGPDRRDTLRNSQQAFDAMVKPPPQPSARDQRTSQRKGNRGSRPQPSGNGMQVDDGYLSGTWTPGESG